MNHKAVENIARIALAAVLAAALAGCISPGWRDSVRESMDASLEQGRAGAKGGKEVPAEVSQALLPPLEITLPDGKTAPIERRFDLSVANAPAREVFMGLVEGTRYSMVLHPEVRGAISLTLKEATVPETMEAIRQVYGYEYRRDGDRFFVLGREMQTRIFQANYLSLVRRGRSDTRVASTGLTRGAAGGATTVSGAEVETLSQADFWKELQATLAAIVGAEGGRKVIVNPQTSLVIVRAFPPELRMVEDYLGATHANVNRQVVLEAKIIEVELKDGFQAGINWAAFRQNGGTGVTIGQVGGGTILGGAGKSEIAGNSGNLDPNAFSAISGTAASAFGGVFTIAAQTADFAAFFELLKTQGEVQVLSSPRVSTVNNQKAVIKVGTDSFFVTKQDITASTVVGGAPTVSTELTPFFSGIALDVTPQIDDSGNINLHIHPSVSEVAEKKVSVTSTQTLSTALSSVQESDNIVRARSGQVIVIGGLMKEGSTDEDASVPLLGDIPLLGNLFKHKKVTRIKKELVILLKPTVIVTGQDWNDTVGGSHERMKKIGLGS